MERVVCPKCKRSVEPIKLFDRSPKTKKPYLIIRCPYERCKFNIDIESYTPKAQDKPPTEYGDGGGGHFWQDMV